MNWKLRVINEVLDSLTVKRESSIKEVYEDFIEVINEVTEDYIQNRDFSSKKNNEDSIKNIFIE